MEKEEEERGGVGGGARPRFLRAPSNWRLLMRFRMVLVVIEVVVIGLCCIGLEWEGCEKVNKIGWMMNLISKERKDKEWGGEDIVYYYISQHLSHSYLP